MRNYLKTKGIDLNKAKSWTLKTREDYDTEDLVIKSWIKDNGELYYTVRQGGLAVTFRGQAGMEDVKSYSDNQISFVVDSVANDLRLQAFVARWVKVLSKENYVGSWTIKKQIKAKKLARKERKKSMDKLGGVIGLIQIQRDNSVKYGKCLKHSTKRQNDRANTLHGAFYDEWIDSIPEFDFARRTYK